MTTTDTETPTEEPAPPPALEPPAEVPFWQRPNVERYLVPIALPIAIVLGLAMFVVNLSRIFLAGHGHASVIIGTLITVSILFGAAGLSSAPQLRSSSIVLITGAFVLSIIAAGWLSVGSAAEKKEEVVALPPEGPAIAELDFVTEGLTYQPGEAPSETGIITIKLTSNSGTHTLLFEDADTQATEIKVAATGDSGVTRAYFGDPGDYNFYCTIQGHRAAGMEGSIKVEGAPKSFAEATAEADAAGGGAAAPAEAP